MSSDPLTEARSKMQVRAASGSLSGLGVMRAAAAPLGSLQEVLAHINRRLRRARSALAANSSSDCAGLQHPSWSCVELHCFV